jgi:hypothetical protein
MLEVFISLVAAVALIFMQYRKANRQLQELVSLTRHGVRKVGRRKLFKGGEHGC